MKKMALLFALALTMGFGSPNQAHAVSIARISLVPDANQASYLPGDTVRVDVLAQLKGGSPAIARVYELQFGLYATSPELTVAPALTHPGTTAWGDIHFLDFTSMPGCSNNPLTCGDSVYYIDDTMLLR